MDVGLHALPCASVRVLSPPFRFSEEHQPERPGCTPEGATSCDAPLVAAASCHVPLGGTQQVCSAEPEPPFDGVRHGFMPVSGGGADGPQRAGVPSPSMPQPLGGLQVSAGQPAPQGVLPVPPALPPGADAGAQIVAGSECSASPGLEPSVGALGGVTSCDAPLVAAASRCVPPGGFRQQFHFAEPEPLTAEGIGEPQQADVPGPPTPPRSDAGAHVVDDGEHEASPGMELFECAQGGATSCDSPTCAPLVATASCRVPPSGPRQADAPGPPTPPSGGSLRQQQASSSVCSMSRDSQCYRASGAQ